MSKQTALQWFMDKLPHSIETQFSKQIQQAMQMEREQIEEAWHYGSWNWNNDKTWENFYKETYGVKGRENKIVVEKDKVIKVEPRLGEWGC